MGNHSLTFWTHQVQNVTLPLIFYFWNALYFLHNRNKIKKNDLYRIKKKATRFST